jgi:putative transposase
MERKAPFMVGEHYHLYTRGVEKRSVFLNDADYLRFTLLLLVANAKEKIHLANLNSMPQGESLRRFTEKLENREKLVDILAYCLMPNHIHLVVTEREENGISKFMLKLMTGYSMYFNIKYDRSGPLFTRPFRSSHIDSDPYFRWLFAYVQLNPLDIFQPDWKENGIKDISAASSFIKRYSQSSYYDNFLGTRPETEILSRGALPIETADMKKFDELLRTFAEHRGIELL